MVVLTASLLSCPSPQHCHHPVLILTVALLSAAVHSLLLFCHCPVLVFIIVLLSCHVLIVMLSWLLCPHPSSSFVT